MGDKISINSYLLGIGAPGYRLVNTNHKIQNLFVANLIDNERRIWKEEVIVNTFVAEDAERILHIPLAREPHKDLVVWSGETSGVFSSTY